MQLIAKHHDYTVGFQLKVKQHLWSLSTFEIQIEYHRDFKLFACIHLLFACIQ